MVAPGLNATVARSVARLTLAASTPGTRPRTFSTRDEQLAQVIPLMDSRTVSTGTEKPARATASARALGEVRSGS